MGQSIAAREKTGIDIRRGSGVTDPNPIGDSAGMRLVIAYANLRVAMIAVNLRRGGGHTDPSPVDTPTGSTTAGLRLLPGEAVDAPAKQAGGTQVSPGVRVPIGGTRKVRAVGRT